MTDGDAKGSAQSGRRLHQGDAQGTSMHMTENAVQMTEKLKREIWENYNTKANILDPTACAMAMQIDLSEQLNKSKGQGHPTWPALQKGINDATGPTFKPVLMYGGQDERDQCVSNNICPTYDPQGHTGDAATPSMLLVEGHTVQAPPEERRHSVSGLDQPRLRATGEVIMSINKKKLRAENWRQRQAMQQAQSNPRCGRTIPGMRCSRRERTSS